MDRGMKSILKIETIRNKSFSYLVILFAILSSGVSRDNKVDFNCEDELLKRIHKYANLLNNIEKGTQTKISIKIIKSENKATLNEEIRKYTYTSGGNLKVEYEGNVQYKVGTKSLLINKNQNLIILRESFTQYSDKFDYSSFMFKAINSALKKAENIECSDTTIGAEKLIKYKVRVKENIKRSALIWLFKENGVLYSFENEVSDSRKVISTKLMVDEFTKEEITSNELKDDIEFIVFEKNKALKPAYRNYKVINHIFNK